MTDRNVFDSVKQNMTESIEYSEQWLKEENSIIRNALAITAGKNEWFKRIAQGTMVGSIVLSHYDTLNNNCRLKKNINSLNSWIDRE